MDFLISGASGAWRGELNAVVGEHGVDLVGDGLQEVAQEVGRDARGRLLVQFDEGELGRPLDGDEEVELAFRGPHLPTMASSSFFAPPPSD